MAAANRQINQREKAALPVDHNFVGRPVIHVGCTGTTCKAHLVASEAEVFPLGEDHWKVDGPKVHLVGGSNIVGFMSADAHLACMHVMAMAESQIGAIEALEPCVAFVAHKQLP
jgi:hypothetical protein